MHVGRKVVVEDGESIERALLRLRRTQVYEFKRWTKHRYGYFEKPSALRRKARKMARIWQLRERYRPRTSSSRCDYQPHLFIGLEELFARNGPTNKAGY